MSSDTLLREVDEELRGDRLRALWRRFGPYIIGGAVAVVLLVAINEGWSWWQQSNAARSSDEFYAALEAAERGDIEAAHTALDTIATQGSGGYRTLAQFRKAGLLAREGKRDEAVAAYDAIATAESNPR
ncbi:MAG TPA: tetratricopeptide repeat protein, partial [Alphaproteobacteria bacterium]|nr:tetratricopeptide repeat protein [Alphaproteobacteria bacterium]